MPWFKVDDGFHSHPKVMELSPAAVGIWTLAGTWSANYLTDGEVRANIVSRLGGTPDLVQELVDAGLWIDMGESYQFKDWADYQPVKADVEAEREAARERMRKVRASKKGVKDSPAVRANKAGTSSEVRLTPAQPSPVPAQNENPGKPDSPSGATPEHRATDDAYTKTGKAFDFIKVRGIAKWAIHERGESEARVSEAIVSAYNAGKPIIKTVIGQYLDGIAKGSKPKGKDLSDPKNW